MLTPIEKDFIIYWQANRNKQKKITKQLTIGLPLGLLFGLPILLNFFSGWNSRIHVISRGQLITLIVAVLIIIVFMAIFSTKFKWDRNEQYYLELLEKQKKTTQN